MIEGVDKLKGAPVMATDLRASVSLVIACACRRRRDDGESRLSPRSRFRAAGRQVGSLRRDGRADQRLTAARVGCPALSRGAGRKRRLKMPPQRGRERDLVDSAAGIGAEKKRSRAGSFKPGSDGIE